MFLSEAFGEDNVSPTIRNMKVVAALSMYRQHQVVIGHFGFVPNDRLPTGYVSATMLRDPAERTFLDYCYQAYDVPDFNLSDVERRIKHLPIEEAFFDPEIVRRFANVQSIHFASFFHPTPANLADDELLRLAKKGLDQYDLVGTTERLAEFCEALKRIFNLPKDVMLKRVNVTSTRKKLSELPPHLQDRIQEINLVVRELWQHANHLFETKTKHFQPLGRSRSVNTVQKEDGSADATPVSIDDGTLDLLGVQVSSRMRAGQGLLAGEEALLTIAFRCNQDIDELTIGYSIHHDSGLHMFGVNTRLMGYNLKCKAGRDYRVQFAFTANLGIGRYQVNVSAHTGLTHLERCFFWKEQAAFFEVAGYLGVNFDGLVRLMPVCQIGDGIEVENTVTQFTGFKTIGIDNPPLAQIKGSIRALTQIPPLRPGQQCSIMVEISNEGEEDWLCEGTRPVNVAYHWRDVDRNIVIFDGTRTPLPGRIVKTGDTIRANALVDAPTQSGEFLLELAVVQEKVCWFEERGFETCTIKSKAG